MDTKNLIQWQFTKTGLDHNDGVNFPISFTQCSFACALSANQSNSDWCEGGGFSDIEIENTLIKRYYSCWKVKANGASQLNNDCYIINIGI